MSSYLSKEITPVESWEDYCEYCELAPCGNKTHECQVAYLQHTLPFLSIDEIKEYVTDNTNIADKIPYHSSNSHQNPTTFQQHLTIMVEQHKSALAQLDTNSDLYSPQLDLVRHYERILNDENLRIQTEQQIHNFQLYNSKSLARPTNNISSIDLFPKTDISPVQMDNSAFCAAKYSRLPLNEKNCKLACTCGSYCKMQIRRHHLQIRKLDASSLPHFIKFFKSKFSHQYCSSINDRIEFWVTTYHNNWLAEEKKKQSLLSKNLLDSIVRCTESLKTLKDDKKIAAMLEKKKRYKKMLSTYSQNKKELIKKLRTEMMTEADQDWPTYIKQTLQSIFTTIKEYFTPIFKVEVSFDFFKGIESAWESIKKWLTSCSEHIYNFICAVLHFIVFVLPEKTANVYQFIISFLFPPNEELPADFIEMSVLKPEAYNFKADPVSLFAQAIHSKFLSGYFSWTAFSTVMMLSMCNPKDKFMTLYDNLSWVVNGIAAKIGYDWRMPHWSNNAKLVDFFKRKQDIEAKIKERSSDLIHDNGKATSKLADMLQSLKLDCDSFLSDKCLNSYDVARVRHIYGDIKTLEEKLGVTEVIAGEKPQPVATVFYGYPGVGKSNLTMTFALAVMAQVYHNDSYMLEKLVKKTSDVIFPLNQAEHYDGYKSHQVVVMDDLGQRKDSIGNPQIDAERMIEIINTFPKRLPMAALEAKAGTFMTAGMFIGSTNLSIFDFKSVHSNEAIIRRITFPYRVIPNHKYVGTDIRIPQFANYNPADDSTWTIDPDKVSIALDAYNLNRAASLKTPVAYLPDTCYFQQWNFRNASPVGQVITFKEMVTRVATRVIRNQVTSERMATHYNEVVNDPSWFQSLQDVPDNGRDSNYVPPQTVSVEDKIEELRLRQSENRQKIDALMSSPLVERLRIHEQPEDEKSLFPDGQLQPQSDFPMYGLSDSDTEEEEDINPPQDQSLSLDLLPETDIADIFSLPPADEAFIRGVVRNCHYVHPYDEDPIEHIIELIMYMNTDDVREMSDEDVRLVNSFSHYLVQHNSPLQINTWTYRQLALRLSGSPIDFSSLTHSQLDRILRQGYEIAVAERPHVFSHLRPESGSDRKHFWGTLGITTALSFFLCLANFALLSGIDYCFNNFNEPDSYLGAMVQNIRNVSNRSKVFLRGKWRNFRAEAYRKKNRISNKFTDYYIMYLDYMSQVDEYKTIQDIPSSPLTPLDDSTIFDIITLAFQHYNHVVPENFDFEFARLYGEPVAAEFEKPWAHDFFHKDDLVNAVTTSLFMKDKNYDNAMKFVLGQLKSYPDTPATRAQCFWFVSQMKAFHLIWESKLVDKIRGSKEGAMAPSNKRMAQVAVGVLTVGAGLWAAFKAIKTVITAGQAVASIFTEGETDSSFGDSKRAKGSTKKAAKVKQTKRQKILYQPESSITSPNRFDAHISVLKDNVFHISIDEDGRERKLGYATFLVEDIFMIPYHFLQEIDATDGIVHFRPYFVDKIAFSINFHDVQQMHQTQKGKEGDGYWDFVLIKPNRRIAQLKKSILHLFLTNEQARSNMNLPCYMFNTRQGYSHISEGKGHIGGYEHYESNEYKDAETGAVTKDNLYVPTTFHYTALTAPGDCGALVSASFPTSERLVGIHTAARKFITVNKAVAFALTQEFLRSMIAKFDKNVNLDNPYDIADPLKEISKKLSVEVNSCIDVKKLVTEGLPKFKDFMWISTDVLYNQPTGSKLRTTVVHEDLKNNGFIKTMPAKLVPFIHEGEYKNPHDIARINYSNSSKALDPVVSNFTEKVIREKVFRTNPAVVQPFNEPRVLTFRQAVMGTEGIEFENGKATSSSSGFPWSLLGQSTSSIIGDKSEIDWTRPELIKLEQDVNSVIQEAKLNRRVTHPFIDCLKDEKRPIEKVLQGRTRQFNVSPLVLLLVCKMYFGDFLRHLCLNRLYNSNAVGMNPHVEWSSLMSNLNWPIFNKFIAGDFKNFDGKTHLQVLYFALDLAHHYYYNASKEDRLVRTIIWEECTQHLHISKGGLYYTDGGNASGSFLTWYVNYIMNFYITYYVLRKKTRQEDISDDELASAVYSMYFGDDNLINVSDKLARLVSPAEFASGVEEYFGMKYTSEDKTELKDAYRTIWDVTFLKRAFSKVGPDIVCPIDMASICETLGWQKKGATKEEFLVRYDAVLCELALHGKDVFEKFKTFFIGPVRREFDYISKYEDFKTAFDGDRSLYVGA